MRAIMTDFAYSMKVFTNVSSLVIEIPIPQSGLPVKEMPRRSGEAKRQRREQYHGSFSAPGMVRSKMKKQQRRIRIH